MASSEEVRKLAALARIEVSDSEVDKFAQEFESILSYVGKIEALVVAGIKDTHPGVRNVMRKDEHPHEPGVHTKKLVAQFPESDGDYLKVKQIISHD
jgi:aspartyl-tRNA(Asn)/glutamyl-tRNA(Gln) amidotransferase subunit C